MRDLFEMEEILSPRMKWIRANFVRTDYDATVIGAEWLAWRGFDEEFTGDGKTESEAIDNLADKLGVVNWEVSP